MVRPGAAALLVLAAAACGALPRPFQAAPGEAANPLVEPRESLVIRVAAVDGPALPLARLLARSVAEELGALGIAAAASAAGILLEIAAVSRAGPGTVGTVLTAQPVISSAVAWLVLGESLSWMQTVGIAVVVVGGLTLHYRPELKKFRRRTRSLDDCPQGTQVPCDTMR